MQTESLDDHVGVVWSTDAHPLDPNIMVSCAGDGEIRLWELESMRCLGSIASGATSDLRTVRFFPDGNAIIAAGDGGFVGVWDLTYHDRHVAGNLRYHLDRLEPDLLEPPDRESLEAWADEVIARPWPRFSFNPR